MRRRIIWLIEFISKWRNNNDCIVETSFCLHCYCAMRPVGHSEQHRCQAIDQFLSGIIQQISNICIAHTGLCGTETCRTNEKLQVRIIFIFNQVYIHFPGSYCHFWTIKYGLLSQYNFYLENFYSYNITVFLYWNPSYPRKNLLGTALHTSIYLSTANQKKMYTAFQRKKRSSEYIEQKYDMPIPPGRRVFLVFLSDSGRKSASENASTRTKWSSRLSLHLEIHICYTHTEEKRDKITLYLAFPSNVSYV